jgi:hypothetical protein
VRKLLVSLLLALATVGVANPAAASAHGTAVPAHELGAVSCVNGGRLEIRPPRVMRPYQHTSFRNPERVAWSPDLYKWNGARWVLVDGTRPWYYAWTSSYGYYQGQFQAAWSSNAGAQLMFVPFTNLTAGHYAVKNYLWWGKTGAKHVEWSRTCRFV